MRKPAPGPTANAERHVITEWGVDPYAEEQNAVLAGFDKLTLEGNLAPDAIRYGFTGQDTDSSVDYTPIQRYPGFTGNPTQSPSLGNDALPTINPPSSSANVRDLLEEAEL